MALTDEDKQWISQQLQRAETRLLTDIHKVGRADADAAAKLFGRIEDLGSGNRDLSPPPRSSTQ